MICARFNGSPSTRYPGRCWCLTTVLIFYVGAPIFRGAWIGLRMRVLNMDNLLAIAILAAYGYSVGQLVSGTLDLYFDVAAVIVAVVTIGRYLEKWRQGARHQPNWSTSSRRGRPSRTMFEIGHELCERPVDELEPGDSVVVLSRENRSRGRNCCHGRTRGGR